MRKVMLILLLAGVSGNVMAEWVRLQEQKSQTIYFDTTSIRRAENTVKVWQLADMKYPTAVQNRTPFSSLKVQIEYDCNQGTLRDLYTAAYAAGMGEGELVFTDNVQGKWAPTVPGSIGEAMLKILCGTQ